MATYTFRNGIESYLDAVNDSAWRIVEKQDESWEYPVDPVYPLAAYIRSIRNPEFVDALLHVRPTVIARILIENHDREIMEIAQKVSYKIGFLPEHVDELECTATYHYNVNRFLASH